MDFTKCQILNVLLALFSAQPAPTARITALHAFKDQFQRMEPAQLNVVKINSVFKGSVLLVMFHATDALASRLTVSHVLLDM